jgi:hypothetical protein
VVAYSRFIGAPLDFADYRALRTRATTFEGVDLVNTQLPEHMARIAIQDMIVGEAAFTVPWSVQVDHEGFCWIRGDYAFTHERFGTSRMSIKRANSGFEVEVSRGTQYERVYISPEAKTQMSLLPVVQIS